MKKISSTQWIAISMVVGIALGYYGPTVETNQRGLDVIKQEAFNTTPDAREWSGK